MRERLRARGPAEALDRVVGLHLVVTAKRERLGVGMDEALLVEHGELVRVVGRARANQSGDQHRLAGEAPAGHDDRRAPVADDAGMDEDGIGGLDPHVQPNLGVEQHQRQLQLEAPVHGRVVVHREPIRPVLLGDQREPAFGLRRRAGLGPGWQERPQMLHQLGAVGAQRRLDAERLEGELMRDHGLPPLRHGG